jgi:crotonobetainyl-CoA:carnitine CoA-transferase CaiB-like acyl-CoA transferase
MIYLAIQNVREWTRFCCDVLGQPDLADDERFRTNEERINHRVELHEVVDRHLARLSTAGVIAALDRAGIAHARMSSIVEFVNHPQLTSRDRWRDIDSPGGPLRALRPPVTLDGAEPAMGAVPALGEHSDAILGELGFSRETIARWRREGTI